jgi:hypothetical protein
LTTRIGVAFGCAVLVLLLFTAHASAKPGVVKTRDGQTYEGDVKEDGTIVTVTTRRVPLTIQRADVESIEYLGTIDEQYAQRMGKLTEKDVNGRIDVARWAFDEGRYDLARDAVESALTIDPNSRAGNTLLESIRVQIRLERAKKGGATTAEARRPTTGPATAVAAGPTTAPATTVIDPRNLLTADDINTIRQIELKQSDTHVRINFSKDVKKRYATAQNIRVQDFNARTQFDQLQEILANGTEDMRRDVRIVSDPASILEYRRVIQPALLQSCATSGCHGAAGAGGLMFFSPADNENVSYTNFFILQTYRLKAAEQQGPFGAGEQRLIDRVEPSRSLLLQYGLPASIAERDHPKVSGYRAVFRNRDDNAYGRVFEWIRDGLKHPLGTDDYGISYTPPTGRGGGHAAPAPTTNPTTEPASTRPS